MEVLKQPCYLSLNPFGSIPTYEEGRLVLFESARPPHGHCASALEPSNFPGTRNIVEESSNLADYVERGKSRPAFQRAFEAQFAVFQGAKN
ncbi:hypothetical protein [Sphingomonas daechungensis]|uniref:hypothetical protein n=1 Tax=Sphingomonas daechungensis TaxID=1176646 RepID=UPI0031E9AD1D